MKLINTTTKTSSQPVSSYATAANYNEITNAIMDRNSMEKIIADLRNENARLLKENASLLSENRMLTKSNEEMKIQMAKTQQILKVEIVESADGNSINSNNKISKQTTNDLAPIYTERKLSKDEFKQVALTVKDLMDDFVEWFNQKVFSITEFAKNIGPNAIEFANEIKDQFLKEIKRSKFINFIKDMIKKIKDLMKIRTYSPLEMSIAEYLNHEEQIDEEKHMESSKIEDMFAMLTNVMNDLTKFKRDVDTRFQSVNQNPVVSSTNPLGVSKGEKINSLSSSYEAHAINAYAIEDRVRKLETEFRLIKNKLN
jgi:hypothetical protein